VQNMGVFLAPLLVGFLRDLTNTYANDCPLRDSIRLTPVNCVAAIR
jgi:hypothetical protein